MLARLRRRRSLPRGRARPAISVCLLAAGLCHAAEAAEDPRTRAPWRAVAQAALAAPVSLRIGADYRVLALDREGMARLLARAPREGATAERTPVVLELPWPDGRFRRFRIEESPIMEPELADEFPELRTYRGQGIDDPGTTARLDWTPSGFHAIALSPEDTVYIEPEPRGDAPDYLVFRRRDRERAGAVSRCLLTAEHLSPGQEEPASGPPPAHGATLRTYRLALAATGEYTAFFGGTVAGAMNGIVTTLNRVNGIYERDLAVRLSLVAGNASLVYTNAATDPYTNDNSAAMLCQNARNLDAVLSSGAYDIGHVFGTAVGGLAAVGVVCNSDSGCGPPGGSNKARGATGIASPQGDPFDVDFVAHEIGHQLGALHTFNGTTGACGGSRSPGSAYEPGSGSTIMSYAGICGSEDLQPHSDAYFHAWSQQQVVSTISASGCPLLTATANTPPMVHAGPDRTIPGRTPFRLTATGTDADGDALTYTWEQFDLGQASPPHTDDGSRPLFRSRAPASSASRTFPDVAGLLGDTTSLGETLPTTSRSLSFRVTARDNRAGGGASAWDDMLVNVRSESGPFAVLQPEAAVSWPAGSVQVVAWDVASTSLPPVAAAEVEITLSLDGGHSFPIVLADRTANDGFHTVTVPNAATTSARVKVEAAGNIFFDVSEGDFTITVVDHIFGDGFESGDVSSWSAAATDDGDLSVTPLAALRSSAAGLQARADDRAGLYVQDETPLEETRYRARFYFDPNGFDPGESNAHRRTRIFIGFEEGPTRRLFALVLRRLAGAYSLMGRVRLDDDTRADTGFFPITDAPHVVEIEWRRSRGPDAQDGSLQLWIDGVSFALRDGLDNHRGGIDFVRLGALSVKSGASGVLYWDEFESRRESFIGP